MKVANDIDKIIKYLFRVLLLIFHLQNLKLDQENRYCIFVNSFLFRALENSFDNYMIGKNSTVS